MSRAPVTLWLDADVEQYREATRSTRFRQEIQFQRTLARWFLIGVVHQAYERLGMLDHCSCPDCWRARGGITGAALDDEDPEAYSTDLVQIIERQRQWSLQTFGPGDRYRAILDHLHKELLEVRREPRDVEEWIDVAILALDGAWRTGASPEGVVQALLAKEATNRARSWPDWRTADPNRAIEHLPDEEGR